MYKIIKQFTNRILPVLLLLIIVSCNRKEQVRVECNEFSNLADLEWFSGVPGDTVSFQKPDESIVKFAVVDKYILHTTAYESNLGCNCHDIWGVLLVNGADTISMHSHLLYDQQQEARYNNFYMGIDGKLSGFINQDRSLLSQVTINGVTFDQLIRFQFEHTDNLQFKTVYIAKETGIVRMERVNGEVWTNTDLERKLRNDYASFRYTETACE